MCNYRQYIQLENSKYGFEYKIFKIRGSSKDLDTKGDMQQFEYSLVDIQLLVNIGEKNNFLVWILFYVLF